MFKKRLSRSFSAFWPFIAVGFPVLLLGLDLNIFKGERSKYGDYYLVIGLLLIVVGILNGIRYFSGPWLPEKYKIEDFVYENRVPIKKRKYVALAALYSDTYEANDCLKKYQLRTEKGNKEGREVLEEYWGIKDSQTAKEMLNWLRFEGHRNDEMFLNEQAEIIEKIKKPQIRDNEVENLIEKINELIISNQKGQEIKINPEEIKEFQSLAAWDYIRGATVAKDCYNYGYLTEKEAWDYLIVFSQFAKENFSSWEQVAISFLIGRYIWSGDSDQEWYINNLSGLFSYYEEDQKIYHGKPHHNTWKKYLLADM